jgi:hypothetical protein
VIAHERALDLGAAAIDFDLALDERRELDGHLVGCGHCRDELEGLRDDARRLASRPRRAVPPSRVAAMTATLERRRSGWSPAMILLAATLLLLLGVATAAVGGAVLRGLERGLEVEVRPSLAPWQAADAEQQPMVGLNGWTTTEAPSAFDGLGLFPQAIVEGDGAWVAAGVRCNSLDRQDECEVTTAWSSDGSTWALTPGRIPLELSSGSAAEGPPVRDAAGGSGGFVMALDSRTDGVDGGSAWWSADGRAWEATSLGPGSRPMAVVRTADGWLIGGSVTRDDGSFAAVWASSDGRTWVEVRDDADFRVGPADVDSTFDARTGIQDMAASGGLVVATGMTCAEGETAIPCRGASWHSTDGRTWIATDPGTNLGCPCATVATSDAVYTLDYRDEANDAGFATDLLRFDPTTGWEVVSDDLLPATDLRAIGDQLLVTTIEQSIYTTPTLRSEWLSLSTDGRTWTDIARIDLVASDISFGAQARPGPDGSIVADTYWIGRDGGLPRWSTTWMRPPSGQGPP